MGIEDAIRARRTGETGTEFVDADGTPVARFAAGRVRLRRRHRRAGDPARPAVPRSSSTAPATTPSTSSATRSSPSTTATTGSRSPSPTGRPAPSTWWWSPRACGPAPGRWSSPASTPCASSASTRLPDHPADRRRHRSVALAQRRPRSQRQPAAGQRRHHPGHADLPVRRPWPRRARPRRRGHDPAPHVRRRRLGRTPRAERPRRRPALLRRRRSGRACRHGAAGAWPWSGTRPTAPPPSAA